MLAGTAAAPEWIGSPSSQQYYIVRVDAAPGVATIAADGCFVTVESGPHPNLDLALEALQHPKQRAYVLPDIVFLPTSATVYALNEPVPHSRPRLVVSAAIVQQARTPQARLQPAGRAAHRRGAASATRDRDDASSGASPAAAAAAAAAAARLSMTPVRWQGGGTGQDGPLSPLALPQQPTQPAFGGMQQQQAQAAAAPAAAAAAAGAGVALPQVPLDLARAAAQVQLLLQQQLARQQAAPVLLPLVQPAPGVFTLATPLQAPQPLAMPATQPPPPQQQPQQGSSGRDDQQQPEQQQRRQQQLQPMVPQPLQPQQPQQQQPQQQQQPPPPSPQQPLPPQQQQQPLPPQPLPLQGPAPAASQTLGN